MGNGIFVWRELQNGATNLGRTISARLGLNGHAPLKPQENRTGSILVRPDEDGFALDAASAVPSRRIMREIAAGQAFFERYGFSFEPGASSLMGADAALRDLAAQAPALTIDTVQPDASIILPVYGQLPFVLNCLESLAAQKSRFSAEIIVDDDASPAEMQTQCLGDISWIRYIRHDKNVGFLDTCNEAAAAAHGRFIVLLNSDTRVAARWLDELVGSFDLFPKAGLVGSKLYNDDGTLQEAGGIFWRDGSAWNYGRDDDGDHPKYCFARRVDYCSGAAIAVSKTAWQAANGFDPIFRPAYCEDADLAFRLRTAGYETWMQPLSLVVHYEGRTHGRDLTSGIKAYQVANMRTFASRWAEALRSNRPEGQEPVREADRSVHSRVLVLDAETPMPDRNCGSVIAVELLSALRDFGHSLTFVPQANYYFDGRYTEGLQRLGIECLYEPYFYNIEDVIRFRDDFDYVLAFRYYVIHPIIDVIRERMARARIIFSNVDLHFLREQREAELHGCRRRRIAAMTTKAQELETFCRADCNLVHTEDEARIVNENVALDNIVVLPYIADTLRSSIGFDHRHDIMYLGGFSHMPNVDAMVHFVEAVWPRLAESLSPKARLLIVGAAPPREVHDLASERIVVTGFVEDLKPWFDSARIFIAPLRFGAGIKGKIIESLRYGIPTVATSVAAEGIGLTSGENALVAELDEDFGQAVLRLYEDEALWTALQQAGYRLVDERFSVGKARDLCVEMLDTADKTWLAREERALKRRLDVIRNAS